PLRPADAAVAVFVTVGLAIALAVVVALPVCALLAALARHPQLRPLLGDLGRPGPARVEALARIALTGLALGAAWAVAAPAVAWVIADFKRMNAAAVLAT